MNELEELLQNMGGSFEDSNFDADTLRTIKGLPVASQNVVKKALMQARVGAVAQPYSKGAGIVSRVGVASSSDVHSLVAESVGDLNLTVKRVGVSIDAPLPFILFGSNDQLADYASSLPNLIARTGLVGLSCAVTISATGNMLFTYTQGDNSDVISVTNIGNINYKSFLASMNQNYFSTKYFLVSISDENFATSQFAQPLLFGKLSALGMTDANQLAFRSRTNSWMYRKDRVECVLPEQDITPDFSFAMNIIAQNNFEIGFDFFMARRINFNKVNR